VSRALLPASLVLVAAATVQATQPVERIEQPADLERGTANGFVVTSRGSLFAGPQVVPYGTPFPEPGPAQVWSMVGDDAGNVFVGTGPDGQIFKVSSGGETSLFFDAAEVMITALAFTRRGDLLAAAAPGGVIYRIGPDGRGELWSETDELYVWTLVPGPGDRVYAGTGQRGRILELDADGRFDLLFDSDESHIVSLSALAGGALLAGGAGRGLVYRIDSEGHAMVLHDDDLSEVVALAQDGETVVVALLDPPEPETRRPVLRLRLPDRTQVGASSETAAETLEEQGGPTLHGVIEGIPGAAEPAATRLRGRLIRIGAAGEISQIWSSTREAPHVLLSDGKGQVYFGTGEPGRIYRVSRDEQVSVLATLEEAQVTGILASPAGVLLSTANPARLHLLDPTSDDPGEFLSKPIDAGGNARWGSIRWSPERAAGTEFYTRSGNSDRPDDTWSAWSPAMTAGTGSRIVNPDGRFLQWRVRQSARDAQGVPLTRVTLTYETYNRAPRVDGFRVDPPGGSARGPVHFHWEAGDPDGDPVQVSVEYRAAGGEAWSVAGSVSTGDGAGTLTWDTVSVAEGVHELRAVGTDQPANSYGEGRAVTVSPQMSLVVDRTPPVVESKTVGAGSVEVTLEDRLSNLRPLELIRDGEVRFTARPADGVCDSKREVFMVVLPAGPGGAWSARGTDAAGNTVEQALDVHGEAD
jgi:hypothetical protein